MTNQLLVHKHLIVRAESLAPLVDEQISINWMYDFIKFVNMKPMMGPFAKYSQMPGNKGLTIATIIETSHIVMHVWDEPNPALIQFDLYSCGEFNPEEIFVVTHDFHMNRSMKIASAVYFLTNIKLISSPSGGPNPYGPKYNFTEPDRLILGDTIRAWIWKLTGILIYWKNVREQRKNEMGTPKKWNEIGF